MVNFTLELNALDLEHGTVETDEYLKSLFSYIFGENYVKLSKKSLKWFKTNSRIILDELNVPGYYNLYVKKAGLNEQDIDSFVNELPLEYGHMLTGKIFETNIYLELKKKEPIKVGTTTLIGAVDKDKNGHIVECRFYLVIQIKE